MALHLKRLHTPVIREPIKLAASGSNTDKIAPPDLDCKIFSFYRVVFLFLAIALISFCESFTFFTIFRQVVKFFFKKFLQISEMVFN